MLDGNLDISIDNETAQGTRNAVVTVTPAPALEWLNNSGDVITWFEGLAPTIGTFMGCGWFGGVWAITDRAEREIVWSDCGNFSF